MGTQELEAFLASKESRQAAAVGTEADRQGRHMARRLVGRMPCLCVRVAGVGWGGSAGWVD